MRKLLVLASITAGGLLFALVLLIVGFDSIVEPFRTFSLLYLSFFLLSSVLLYIVYVLRWAAVLKYQGIKVPFLLLLRYKLIGSSINYLTPVSRIGGEPVKAYLFKKKMKTDSALSSIVLETMLGMFTDVLFVCFLLVFMIIFFALPSEIASLSLMLSLIGLALIAVYFSTLLNRKGPLSHVIRVVYLLLRKPILKKLIEKIRIMEEQMTEFLRLRKKGVIQAVAISMISWPLTFLQYKFALLSIGFEASFTIIFLSIVATTIASIMPIPAAFGVQEAGHISLFSLVATANIGFALSIFLRLKDLIITFVGLTLLSHEGLDIIDILRKNNKKIL